MARGSRNLFFDLRFGGGWNTELGPSASFAGPPPQGTTTMTVPYLLRADNCIFEADGGPHKMPGGSALNSVALTANIMGLFDYWRSNASGVPTQKRMASANTQIFKEDLDGTWDSIATGLESNRIPSFWTAKDLVIWASDSTVDVPRSWDQTAATTSALAGTPPNFAFGVQHKGRSWAAGVASNKSRLYYSVLDNVEDWAGAGSGSIDIEPNDGGVITGLASHKNDLWVFKGPNILSIHRITGSAPTGTDAFARIPFVTGVGCAAHNSIIRVGDDLVFADINGVHSLKATAAFGDFNEKFLTRDIQSFWHDQLNHNRDANINAAHYVAKSYALFSVARSGSTSNNALLMLDFRFDPPRWAAWIAFTMVQCVATMVDGASGAIPFAGTDTGHALRLDRVDRNIRGAAYNMDALLPFVAFTDPYLLKTLGPARIGIAPKGNYNYTLGWGRDGSTQQTTTIAQSGSDVMGTAASNQFTLGTSTLAGGRYTHGIADLTGEFRELQLQLTQGTVDQDLEVHSIGLQLQLGAVGEESD